MFSPFGEIDNIDLPRDHITGRNIGYCVIQFVKHRDAKDASKAMDGEKLGNASKTWTSYLIEFMY